MGFLIRVDQNHFGPQRLAGIGGAVGRAIREFRGAVREAEDEIEKSTNSEKRAS